MLCSLVRSVSIQSLEGRFHLQTQGGIPHGICRDIPVFQLLRYALSSLRLDG